MERDLEEARYDASLAERRYELVDPAKRHVARQLEARWNAALERVAELQAAHLGSACYGRQPAPGSIDRCSCSSPMIFHQPGTRRRPTPAPSSA